jgi:ElaB/YqjD/DUF883 family membrane-anchored ribosome-binding protein
MKKIDELLDKTKEMADKAEAFVEEKFEKAKESETYAKVTDLMNQAGEYVDKKIEELKEGELPGKLESFRERAETQAEKMVDQAKAYGTIIAGDVEEVIDNLKGKLSGNDQDKKPGAGTSGK